MTADSDRKEAVMEEGTGYNGWSNYETWSVALIVDNDYGLYQERRDFVRSCVEAALRDKPDYFTEDEAKRFFVADRVKEWITDAVPEMDNATYGPLCYLWQQLLGAALSEVSWFEIADAWLEDVTEEQDA